MNKCLGCGVFLQTKNKNALGFIPEEKYNKSLCERCFRIVHYNEFKIVEAPKSQEFLNTINKSGQYAFFLCDLLNINKEVINTYKKIIIPKCLIISKIDYIPKYINKEKIKNWLKKEYDLLEDIHFISVKKNYNIQIINTILREKSLKEGYLLGYTNAGKSSLINKLNKDSHITTSSTPNTTLDFIKIKISESLSIIDTPGFNYQNSFYEFNNQALIKKFSPKNVLKPLTYQLKKGTSIVIEDNFRLENVSDQCNITLYLSNLLNLKKIYEKNIQLKNLKVTQLRIKKNQDLVIKGVGFINCKNDAILNIYLKNENILEVRNSFFER